MSLTPPGQAVGTTQTARSSTAPGAARAAAEKAARMMDWICMVMVVETLVLVGDKKRWC